MTLRPQPDASSDGWGCKKRAADAGPAPLVVSAREAARMLSISTRTLSELTSTGEMPSLKIARRRLYRVADIEAFIEARVEGGGRR
jgi:excisionase family DNA binding protein